MYEFYSVIAFKQAPTCLYYNKFDFQSINSIKSITINLKPKILLALNSTKSYLSNEHPHVYIKANLIFNQLSQISQLSKIRNFKFYQHRILQSHTFPTNHKLLKTHLKWLRYSSDSQTSTITYVRNSRALRPLPALLSAARRFPTLPGELSRSSQCKGVHIFSYKELHIRSFIYG